jgi:hypothetical protein
MGMVKPHYGFPCFIAVCVLIACLHASSIASAQSRFDLDAWLMAEINRKPSRESLRGHVFKWHREYYYIPPREELEAIRQRVKGKPEHPERRILEKYEPRLIKGPIIDPFAFYLVDARRWRLVRDLGELSLRNPGMFMDAGENDVALWTAMPQSLIIDSRGILPDASRSHKTSPRDEADFAFTLLIEGPLASLRNGVSDLSRISKVDIAPGHWKITIDSTPDLKQAGFLATEIQGRWDQDRRMGLFESSRWIISPELEKVAPQAVYKYGPRVSVPALGCEAFKRVTVYEPPSIDFDPEWAMVFDSIEPFPENLGDVLTATPKSGQQDPIRGTWQFEVVRDASDVVAADPGSHAGTSQERTLQIAGIIIAIVVPCCVLCLWLAHKRKTANARG